jgi:chemotaxis signal transduction protein
MSQAGQGLSEAVLAMRREFDLSFAQLPRSQTAKFENFLGIHFGDDAYAIRTSEIIGLHVDCRITPLPSPVSALRGVACFRGLIAPVYDLAELLGYTCKTPPRWLVLVNLSEPVALAFETFDTHFSADSSAIVMASQSGAGVSTPVGARAHLFDAVRTDDATRPIIHLQSLLESIQRSGESSLRQRSM